jgi:reactive chlorine resistance protein C
MSATAHYQTIAKQSLVHRAATLALAAVDTAAALGRHAARYGLVLVLIWIGGMKFTAYEAEGISGFVSNSPLMSWAYSVFSVRSFAAVLGVAEVATALLIASRLFSPRAALVGSGLAVGMFLTTLSFLLTTPGVWEASAGGFPALSVVPGQFLVKDFVLLGAALRLFSDDWRALRIGQSRYQNSN